MKTYFNRFLLFTIILSALYSCTKKIEAAYQNPNSPVRVPIEQLLPPVISTLAANGAGHGPLNDVRYAGLYIQSWAAYTVSTTRNTPTTFERMGGVLDGSDAAGSIFRAHYFDIGQIGRAHV